MLAGCLAHTTHTPRMHSSWAGACGDPARTGGNAMPCYVGIGADGVTSVLDLGGGGHHSALFSPLPGSSFSPHFTDAGQEALGAEIIALLAQGPGSTKGSWDSVCRPFLSAAPLCPGLQPGAAVGEVLMDY